jgi:hypothetical protein
MRDHPKATISEGLRGTYSTNGKACLAHEEPLYMYVGRCTSTVWLRNGEGVLR